MDAHSGAISAAMLQRNGVLESHIAQVAILLGFTTNAVTKIVVSFIAGPAGYAVRVAFGAVASVAAAWGTWLLTERLMAG